MGSRQAQEGGKKMKRETSLTVATLHTAVDFIVEKSGQDVCQICAFYCKRSQAESFEQDENVEPCVWRRTQGNVACRDGIIEKIQMDILRGGNVNV